MTQRFPCSFSLIVLLAFGSTVGCSRNDQFPSGPITLVCPWSAGGGTDRTSRQVAIFLQEELGVPVNVINATGGQGVTGHARGMQARPDGHTIAMMTLELSCMHWRGLTDLDYLDCVPLMSVNEDAAALFVRRESPFQNVLDLEAAVKDSPGTLKASGTANLGAWHLALAGWLLSCGGAPDDITWIPSQGSAPSLQELMSGGVDMVCCSVPEAQSLLDSGEVRCLGVMSEERLTLPGLEHHPTFREQGSDWSLAGWRGLGMPPETPDDIRDKLIAALKRIVTGETSVNGQTFPGYMESEGFDHTWRAGDDFAAYLARVDKQFGDLLQRPEFRNVKGGPIGPNRFPLVAACIAAISLVLIGISALQRWRGSPADTTGDIGDTSAAPRSSLGNRIAFSSVPLATAAYALFADEFGFIPIAAVILLVLSLLLHGSVRVAFVLAVIASPVIYLIFTDLLRVPLPPGWFG